MQYVCVHTQWERPLKGSLANLLEIVSFQATFIVWERASDGDGWIFLWVSEVPVWRLAYWEGRF